MSQRNHEFWTTCPQCGKEFDLRKEWPTCPKCGYDYRQSPYIKKIL